MSKVALVTGSSRGIGKAIALELAKSKCNVVVNYNSNQEEAEKVVSEIKEAGADAIAVKANISNQESVTSLIKETVDKFGKIDILVNNAGITKDRTLKKMSNEEWDAVIQTNLSGIFYTIKEALPHMGEGGRIVNLSSIVGLYGNFGQTNYAATKAGVIGLTKSLSKEQGAKGITVNAVAPGFIKTDMTKGIGFVKEKIIKQMISLKDFGEPKDVATAVAFLASDSARYITGTVLSVDGGLAF